MGLIRGDWQIAENLPARLTKFLELFASKTTIHGSFHQFFEHDNSPHLFITTFINKNQCRRQVAVQEEGRDSEEVNRVLVAEAGEEEGQQEGEDHSGMVQREELEGGGEEDEEDELARREDRGNPDSMTPD